MTNGPMKELQPHQNSALKALKVAGWSKNGHFNTIFLSAYTFNHNFLFLPQHYLSLKLNFALRPSAFLTFQGSHTLKSNHTHFHKSNYGYTCGKDSSGWFSATEPRLTKLLVKCHGCAMTYYQAHSTTVS